MEARDGLLCYRIKCYLSMVILLEISSLTLASSHSITWPLIDLHKLANFSQKDLKLFKQPLPVPLLVMAKDVLAKIGLI